MVEHTPKLTRGRKVSSPRFYQQSAHLMPHMTDVWADKHPHMFASKTSSRTIKSNGFFGVIKVHARNFNGVKCWCNSRHEYPKKKEETATVKSSE